jgi:flagella basal body P-ring formation protein FlgA
MPTRKYAWKPASFRGLNAVLFDYHGKRGGRICRLRRKLLTRCVDAERQSAAASRAKWMCPMTCQLILRLVLVVLTVYPVAASSAERQEVAQILGAVERFARTETAGLPGRVSIRPGAVDPRLNLAACPVLEPFLPAGSRLWGQSVVGVRCNGPVRWTIYVPVGVEVIADVVYAARPLAQGETVSRGDITLQRADLAQLPAGALAEPEGAIGKTLTSSIGSGQILRKDLLRAPLVVQQGQTVRLLAQGRGFRVTSEGKALAAAAVGQVVQVRTYSGQIVSGIARPDAIVEVQP